MKNQFYLNFDEQVEKLAQKESDYYWSIETPTSTIPKQMMYRTRLPFSCGRMWRKFINLILECRP